MNGVNLKIPEDHACGSPRASTHVYACTPKRMTGRGGRGEGGEKEEEEAEKEEEEEDIEEEEEGKGRLR